MNPNNQENEIKIPEHKVKIQNCKQHITKKVNFETSEDNGNMDLCCASNDAVLFVTYQIHKIHFKSLK